MSADRAGLPGIACERVGHRSRQRPLPWRGLWPRQSRPAARERCATSGESAQVSNDTPIRDPAERIAWQAAIAMERAETRGQRAEARQLERTGSLPRWPAQRPAARQATAQLSADQREVVFFQPRQRAQHRSGTNTASAEVEADTNAPAIEADCRCGPSRD
jgi:hypothetical protein